jgi:hypothetical protein
VPPVPPTALSGYLPPEAAAYVYLDVAAAPELARRIIAAAGVEDREARRILARTARVAAALIGAPTGAGGPGAASPEGAGQNRGSGGTFVLAASGRIPGFLVEAMLEDDEEWSRRTVTVAGTRYGLWRRRADGLELAFPDRRLVLAGTGAVEAALAREAITPAPGSASADRHAAVIALPRSEMPGPFGVRRIEVEDLELRANPVDRVSGEDRGPGMAEEAGQRAWRIGGTMRLPDEGTARAVTALVRLLAISMIADTGADPSAAAGELDVERDRSTVMIEGIVMDERYLLEALDEFPAAVVTPRRGEPAADR